MPNTKKAIKDAEKGAKEVGRETVKIGKTIAKTVKKVAGDLTETKKVEKEIGIIVHFFDKISVAVVELTGELKVGDTIHIKGTTSDFKQKVESMQIEHDKIKVAKKGQAIGIKTKDFARVHDKVFVIK